MNWKVRQFKRWKATLPAKEQEYWDAFIDGIVKSFKAMAKAKKCNAQFGRDSAIDLIISLIDYKDEFGVHMKFGGNGNGK